MLLTFLLQANGIAIINRELCSPQASLPLFFLLKALEYNLVRAKFLKGHFYHFYLRTSKKTVRTKKVLSTWPRVL